MGIWKPSKCLEVDVNGRTKANPHMVYEIAKDSSGYPRWSQIGSFEHVRSGQGETYGVGSLRIFRTWPLKLLEEVVELVPDRRVGYVLHRGLPFRDYRATIELTPIAGGGTHIRWFNSFYANIPGTNAWCQAFMRGVLREIVDRLAAEADRIEKATSSTDKNTHV